MPCGSSMKSASIIQKLFLKIASVKKIQSAFSLETTLKFNFGTVEFCLSKVEQKIMSHKKCQRNSIKVNKGRPLNTFQMKNHWTIYFFSHSLSLVKSSSEMSQCDAIKIDIEKWTGNVCLFFAKQFYLPSEKASENVFNDIFPCDWILMTFAIKNHSFIFKLHILRTNLCSHSDKLSIKVALW